jgi:hypothetical protein
MLVEVNIEAIFFSTELLKNFLSAVADSGKKNFADKKVNIRPQP